MFSMLMDESVSQSGGEEDWRSGAHLEHGAADQLHLRLHPHVSQSSAPLPHRGDLVIGQQHSEAAGARAKLVGVHHHLEGRTQKSG